MRGIDDDDAGRLGGRIGDDLVAQFRRQLIGRGGVALRRGLRRILREAWLIALHRPEGEDLSGSRDDRHRQDAREQDKAAKMP